MATYIGGQSQATVLTQAQIAEMQEHILQVYRDALDEINKELSQWYAKYLTSIPEGESYIAVMGEYNRITSMQASIRELYNAQSLAAGQLIQESSKMAFANAWYREQYLQQWFIEVSGLTNVGFVLNNPALMEASVYSRNEIWSKLTKDAQDKLEALYGSIFSYYPKAGSLTQLLLEDRQEQLNAIRKAIDRAMLKGTPYPELSKQIESIIGTEILKDGVVHTTGSKAQAMSIVRTEGNRTMNAGAYAYDKYISEQYGLPMRRQMTAVFDMGTRQQSAEMHGQERAIDEPFDYPDGSKSLYPGNSGNPKFDVNDRETTITIVDGIEPEAKRFKDPYTGAYKIFSYRGFDDWRKENGLKWNKYGRLIKA